MQLQYPFWSRSIDGGAFFAGGYNIIHIFLAEIDFHNDFSCRKAAAYWMMINDVVVAAAADDDDDVDGLI